MATTISSIFSLPTESYFISITWPPPCAPMHLMEVTLPSLHMATTMHNKYIRKPRLSSSHGHNHVSNVPGLPNLSATTEEGNPSGHIRTSHKQHTHTSTLANPSYNSRFLVFICYPEPQLKGSHSGPQPIECHVLNPYPEPQLKDTFRTTTHGTPASSPSRYLRSLIDHTSPFNLRSIQYCNLLLLNLSPIHL